MEKPPAGVAPRCLVMEDRLDKLDAAIRRYLEARCVIPEEWVEERNEIIKYLNKRK